MKILFSLFIFLLSSLSFAGFVEDHKSSDYTSTYKKSVEGQVGKNAGEDCDPDTKDSCKGGFECKEFENNEESFKLFPNLYKKDCLFRRVCAAGEFSPKVLCEKKCEADSSDEIKKTYCLSFCVGLDSKCSYKEKCLEATPKDDEAKPASCHYDKDPLVNEKEYPAPNPLPSGAKDYLRGQHQECDSNRCLPVPTEGPLCMPAAKCVPKKDETQTPLGGQALAELVIPYVEGSMCKPHLYEVQNGVVIEDDVRTALHQSDSERVLHAFEYISSMGVNIQDYFGINQRVISFGKDLQKRRTEIQKVDNLGLSKLEEVQARLSQVASGVTYYEIMLEQYKILLETNIKKSEYYTQLAKDFEELVNFVRSRPYDRWQNESNWYEISWKRITFHSSICHKYRWANKYCVKNCWELPQGQKIVDPLIPGNMGKLQNDSSGTENYSSVMASTAASVMNAGLSDPLHFSDSALGELMKDQAAFGLVASISSIAPFLDTSGVLGNFDPVVYINKWSKPKVNIMKNFNSVQNLNKLQNNFALTFGDYANGKISGSTSATFTMVPSIASEFDMKVHLASTVYQKDIRLLTSEENKVIENKLVELKKSKAYMDIRKSLSLAETGKKAFEFFKWYGSNDSCIYNPDVKSRAIRAVYQRALYESLYYQAAVKQTEMMIECLSNVINALKGGYEHGTGEAGGGTIPKDYTKDMGKILDSSLSLSMKEQKEKIKDNPKLSSYGIGGLSSQKTTAEGNKTSEGISKANSGAGTTVSNLNSSGVDAAFNKNNKSKVSIDDLKNSASSKKMKELNQKIKDENSSLEKLKNEKILSMNRSMNDGLESRDFMSSAKGSSFNYKRASGLTSGEGSSSENTKNLKTKGEKDGSLASLGNLNSLNLNGDHYKLGSGSDSSSSDPSVEQSKVTEDGASSLENTNLTGVSSAEALRIREGLKDSSKEFQADPNNPDDSLFKIVTKAYFRSAYPKIFKKEEKKN